MHHSKRHPSQSRTGVRLRAVHRRRWRFTNASAAMAVCSNCGRDVPTGNAVMHEAVCFRNFRRCDHCNELVERSQAAAHAATHESVQCACGEWFEARVLPQHQQDACSMRTVPCSFCGDAIPRALMSEHEADCAVSPVGCDACHATVPRAELPVHVTSECLQRSVTCEYCTLAMTAQELMDHADACGSRTEPCDLCQAYVQLRDLDRHISSGCAFPPRVSRPRDVVTSDATPERLHEPTLGDFGASALLRDTTARGRRRQRFGNTDAEDMTAVMDDDMEPHQLGDAGLDDSFAGGDDPAHARDAALLAAGRESNQGRVCTCPYCSRLCDNFEELQIHMLTACPQANASDADGAAAGSAASMETESPPPPYAVAAASRQRVPSLADAVDTEAHPLVVPRQRRVAAPAAPVDTADAAGDVPLSCEFCADLFPADVLMQHQHACRAAHQRSPAATTAASEPLPTAEVELPCEFCDQSFAMSVLMDHQTVCRRSGSNHSIASASASAAAAAAAASEPDVETTMLGNVPVRLHAAVASRKRVSPPRLLGQAKKPRQLMFQLDDDDVGDDDGDNDDKANSGDNALSAERDFNSRTGHAPSPASSSAAPGVAGASRDVVVAPGSDLDGVLSTRPSQLHHRGGEKSRQKRKGQRRRSRH